ncbi:MAG: hypothetical protein IV084_01360 [Rugosibacter sp.]|nr:hypothetical protein [Rugosibacter sp.]
MKLKYRGVAVLLALVLPRLRLPMAAKTTVGGLLGNPIGAAEEKHW